MSDAATGLKDCPFCDSPAEMEHDADEQVRVECSNIGCMVSTPARETDAEATTIWNRRAP